VDFSELAPWLTPPGLGALAYVFLKLHQSAIAAHREARDGWRALALEREKQLMEIFGAVREAKDKAS
jgi:hypothetical protein